MGSWKSFSEGQPTAGKVLMNSLKKNRVSHAYLIHGGRGTGKKQLAQLLTQTLYCEALEGIEPCQSCHACKRIKSGNHPDVHWIAKEGQSIRNEQVDHLRKEFSFSGLESKRKVYVIQDADTLTVQAANRLLKFLEEPNIETLAILLTENDQVILPTIRSRCQLIDLQPLNQSAFRERLVKEGLSEHQARLMSAITYNIDEAHALIKDETFLSQLELIKQFHQALLTQADFIYLFLHDSFLKEIKERDQIDQALDILLISLQDIIYVKSNRPESVVFFDLADSILVRAVEHYSIERLLQVIRALMEAKQKLKQNVNPTFVMEQFVLQI